MHVLQLHYAKLFLIVILLLLILGSMLFLTRNKDLLVVERIDKSNGTKLPRVNHYEAAASMLLDDINGYKICLDDEKNNLVDRLLAKIDVADDNKPANLCVERSSLTELIILTGHSQFIGSDFKNAESDDSWVIRSYQTGHGKVFYEQIKKSVEILAERENALLVFSGGAVESSAPPIAESISYWLTAEHHNWWGYNPLIRLRAVTEDYSWDSLQNMLFSLCRFKQVTGKYPLKIAVVGMPFKKRRFTTVHREALKIPVEMMEYIGAGGDFPEMYEKMEIEKVIPEFEKDLYACHGDLKAKKLARNKNRRWPGFLDTCPEMEGLFTFCSTESNPVYPGSVPW